MISCNSLQLNVLAVVSEWRGADAVPLVSAICARNKRGFYLNLPSSVTI